MKDAIDGLIKRVYLSEYTKDDKRDREESAKNKSPFKTVDIMASGEGTSDKDKGASKRKHQLITTIIGETPLANPPIKRENE